MRFALFLILALLTFPADAAPKRVRVKGSTVKATMTRPAYWRAAYVRTAPDRSKRNNWSTKDNFNPYTGKRGSKKR